MKYTIAISILFASTCSALAAPLTFTGQNAAIFANANPGGNAALLASVNRPRNPALSSGSSALSPSNILQQSILSQASSRINDQIFNSTPGQSGSFDLGGGNFINFSNIAGVITLTVINPQGTTVIGGL